MHNDLRFYLLMIKAWLEPLLDSSKIPFNDDEFIFRMVHHYRTARDTKKAPAGPRSKRIQEDWHELQSIALEQEGEEAFDDDPSKLSRSAVGHLCKHFVFLRHFVRRLRVKERGSNGKRRGSVDDDETVG